MRAAFHFLFVGLLALLLSGCASGGLRGSNGASASVDVRQFGSLNLTSWEVVVPRSLTTSEANLIKPRVNLLWQEEAPGDRYAQVKTIIEEGVSRAAKRLKGTRDVTVQLVVRRFHAQTPKVRYTFGGEHELEFDLTIIDAKTGAALVPSYFVDATFPAFGGEQAVAADRAGITQRMRIIDQIEVRLVQELTGAPRANIPDVVGTPRITLAKQGG